MSDGKRFNKEKLRWRNIPMFLLEDLIKVGQFGEGKYDTFNFLKGFPINDILDSAKRHLTSFENPFESDHDSESGQSHLMHCAWNLIVAHYVMKFMPHKDDRYKPDTQAADVAKLRDFKVIQEGLDKEAFLSFNKKNPDDTSK